MRKITGLIIFSFIFTSLYAQHTTPRFGTRAGQDNTGRVLTYAFQPIADSTGNDTITFVPKAHETIIIGTLKDSVSIQFNDSVLVKINDTIYVKRKNQTTYFLGDKVTLILTANSSNFTHKLKLVGNLIPTNETISVTKSKRVAISFIFDGVKWKESYELTE